MTNETNAIQKRIITHTSVRESKLPKTITAGGLRIGYIIYKGKRETVFLPTKDLDGLCLPHIVIGDMGTGKTMDSARIS